MSKNPFLRTDDPPGRMRLYVGVGLVKSGAAHCKDCHMEPASDNDPDIDLCSEATGMFNGQAWRIVRCPKHGGDAVRKGQRILQP